MATGLMRRWLPPLLIAIAVAASGPAGAQVPDATLIVNASVLDAARAAGVVATADIYPYTFWHPGTITAGAHADLVLFDSATIIDRSTTASRPGRVLRRQ